MRPATGKTEREPLTSEGVAADSVGSAVRRRIGGEVFRYRLHSPDGDDLGEAVYAVMIKPGEEIHLGAGQRFCVLDVVPFEEEDESPFVRLLQVVAA